MVTVGAKGALIVTQQGTWLATPPPIQPISTVGAGDSTLAGYCAATLMDNNDNHYNAAPYEALRYAVAAGTADALTDAPGVVEQEMVNQIAAKVRVQRFPKRAKTQI